jgi:hypothetical protein
MRGLLEIADYNSVVDRAAGEMSEEAAMRCVFRAVAVVVLVSLAGAGPLASWAAAQQPTPPPAQQPAAPPPATQPQMFQEDVKPVAPRRGVDAYDIGAGVATVFAVPGRAFLCGVGIVAAITIFAMTFGSRPHVSGEIIDEGCAGRHSWVVRGDDLRPRPTPADAAAWETRSDWQR